MVLGLGVFSLNKEKGRGEFYIPLFIMNEENEKTEYATYNSLTRKALVGGVPLMILVGFSFAIIISLVVGFSILPTSGALVVPIILCVCLFGIKVMCEENSNAMDNVSWVIKGALLRLKSKSIVCSISPQADSDAKRKVKINEFFKQFKQ
ncbi:MULTISPECIES: VirB3 family type IV secretion system protein [Vibrio harveyi group]|uniref:VirB3 family type IV secretion system protein n=1 Tax=Vibrio harveyi group TaxID=717610 RepID=UPI0010FF1588|nr:MULTISPECIES: VirB3 family type IV secretion system protein [Vibrio harveyi group]WHP52923.1 VirB3 family type IV secretion system protein [Vibrio parahaemolyticus]